MKKFAAAIAIILLPSGAMAEWTVSGTMIECRAENPDEGISIEWARSSPSGGAAAYIAFHGNNFNDKFDMSGPSQEVTLQFDKGVHTAERLLVIPNKYAIWVANGEQLGRLAAATDLWVWKGGEIVGLVSLKGSGDAVRRFFQCYDRATGGIHRRKRF